MRTASLTEALTNFYASSLTYLMTMVMTYSKVSSRVYSGNPFRMNSARNWSSRFWLTYSRKRSFLIVLISEGFWAKSMSSLE